MLRKHDSIFFLLLIFFMHDLQSQTFSFRPNKFGPNLFAGGIDNPRYQFVDIDSDSDYDLFIFDRDERLWFYRNNGATFVLEPEETFGLTIGSWFHFVDIDSDGDLDCFTNGEFSDVQLYINIGSPTSPAFQLTSAPVKDTTGNELFSERPSVPTFADIDADGDLDFFTGSQIGSITFYKNVGTSSNPKFAFVTNEFDGIKIIGGGRSFPKAKHGASGIEFFDSDGNGTLDLFWGDYFNPSMYHLENIGTPQNAHYVLQDSTYPKEATITTIGFNIPQHVDIDGDGLVDLMAGSVFPNEGYDNLWYLKNTGTNTQPFYQLQTKNFLPMIDVGVRSSVTLADVDGDGDAELCVSSGGGTINIFQNTGSSTHPAFSSMPVYTITLQAFYVTIAAGDLNGDGKPDLLVGDFTGNIRYFQNTTTSTTISFTQTSFPLDGVNVGNSSAPCIADVDQDGVTDVLIGTSGGTLQYYKNTGTNSAPQYSLVSTSFNSIDVGNDAMPLMIDVDGNGKNDLLIGHSEGTLYRYEYNPSNQQYDFITPQFGHIDVKINASPAMVDIDGDGDLDLFIGNGKGGVFFYENTTINSIEKSRNSTPAKFELQQNYPNPFNPSTIIEYSLPVHGFVTLQVYDVLGKKVKTLVETEQSQGRYSVEFNGREMPSGVYFYRLKAGDFTAAKKLLLMK
jgi:hypothetical protein